MAVENYDAELTFVGLGGLPNADGILELDAAIMDFSMRYGAVMCLQQIRNPISVAKSIMEHCVHNILSGDGAQKWAVDHGFRTEDLATNLKFGEEFSKWKNEQAPKIADDSHDTIGLLCLDANGKLCAGTSTSGWKFKHPGRVGDSPLVGGGLYCDGTVGAAVATGDGEEVRTDHTRCNVV